MKTNSISIVVVTLGQRDSLKNTFNSILRSVGDLDFEVVVVAPENAHKEIMLHAEVAGLLDYISLVADQKSGIYAGFDIGLINSKNEWVIYINDDDFLIENALNTVFLNQESYEEIDFIAGITLMKYECCNFRFEVLPCDFRRQNLRVGRMPGTHQAQIWRRSSLMKIDGFKENAKIWRVVGFKFKLAADFYNACRAFQLNMRCKLINQEISVMSTGGASWVNWRRVYVEILVAQLASRLQNPAALPRFIMVMVRSEIWHLHDAWYHQHLRRLDA